MNLTRKQVAGDRHVDAVRELGRKYESANPGSEAKSYRQSLGSIRLRVIDPSFKAMEFSDRYRKLWAFLTELPPDVQGQISVCLLLAPDEVEGSSANADFENPGRSRL